MKPIFIHDELTKFSQCFAPGFIEHALKPTIISKDGIYQLSVDHSITLIAGETFIELDEEKASTLLSFCAYRFLSSGLERFTKAQRTTIKCAVEDFYQRLSPLMLAYCQSFNEVESSLKFGDMRENDFKTYGENVLFHHKEKKGNKRFDVFLHENEGQYTAIFRRSYSKRNNEGKNTTYVNAESIVRFTKESFDKSSVFPAGMEFLGSILLESDSLKNMGK